jgi:large subunit ribosomal protein L21
MTYAIVKLGGKQYRVQEGEKLLVDRIAMDENATFHPEVLLVGGDGPAQLAPQGVQVTAKVVGHVLGKKIVIGKHRKRTGYRRKNGFRASLSQIQIETIGKKAARTKQEAGGARLQSGSAAASEQPKAAPKPKATTAAKPKPAAAPKPKSTTAAKPKTTTRRPKQNTAGARLQSGSGSDSKAE